MNRIMTPTRLLQTALEGKVAVSAGELRVVFEGANLSPSTLQRAVASSEGLILRLGEARSTRYALTRDVMGTGRQWPMWQTDELGRTQQVASVHALQNDHWAVVSRGSHAPRYLHLGSEDGIFRGPPWYLEGLRPDGFLGRSFAHRWASALGAPEDVRFWSSDHVLVSASRGLLDPPGNLFLKAANVAAPRVLAANRAAEYEQLAAATLAGEAIGSSAGGEQPKFSARVQHETGSLIEVIVKFSPPRNSPAGERWADLLVGEHLASQLLREHGIEASDTALVESDSRLYLEVKRFDRVGERGRRGMCALMPFVPSLGGPATSWTEAMRYLHEESLVDDAAVERAAFLDDFGAGIGNNDRHLGNLSLMLDEGPFFDVAPVYDMLPMRYRPKTSGEVTVLEPVTHAFAQDETRSLAGEFWRRVADHPLITWEFRRLAEQNIPANNLDLRSGI
ncbi:MAG: HipA domain-containing protein [Rudaea sp.]|uniref:HipA domain-containing protein n=1 Tax=unclassified Rudaea TaxID=2627037 RepID=UPI0010F9F22F|nr:MULTISPECIES: HipA domain-containing protein [unclassified Rudaea]MBN8888435.1 HipA domain-containing protein [Rudaea sp.]MBR0347530.1 HipA domain-containing protein [Rudaea sp.]